MLQQLKTEAIDALLADPYFGDAPGIPIVDDRTRELDIEIQKALAKIALCVFCTVPVAISTESVQNLKGTGLDRGPYLDEVTLFFRVFELPILNTQNNQDGTGKTGLETAQTIAAILHMWRPTGANEPVIFNRIALADDPIRQAWDVVFSHRGGIKYPMVQVSLPALGVLAGTATITTATSGAAIFYTVNGSEPTPRSGTFYTAPFAVGSGVRIRTRAYLAGYLASKETSVTTS